MLTEAQAFFGTPRSFFRRSFGVCTYGRGVQNRFILNTMLTNYNLAKNKGTARSPKWVVDDELLAFVGEDTYKQESNTKEYLKWLRDCVKPIKDFLSSQGCPLNVQSAMARGGLWSPGRSVGQTSPSQSIYQRRGPRSRRRILCMCQAHPQNGHFPHTKRPKSHPARSQRPFLKVKNEPE